MKAGPKGAKVVPEPSASLHEDEEDGMPEAAGFRAKLVQNGLLFLVSTFYCVVTPIRVAILDSEPTGTPLAVMLCDLTLDTVIYCDTVRLLHARYKNYKQQRKLGKAGAGWGALKGLDLQIWLTVMTIIPTVSDVATLAGAKHVVRGFGMLRMLRGIRLRTHIRTFVELAKAKGCEINHVVLRTVVVLFALMLGTSFVGCLYFLVSARNPEGWVYNDRVIMRKPTPFGKYIRALHYSVQTVFTVGYGDAVVPLAESERVFGIAWLLASCLLNGLIVASITSLVANKDIINANYRQKIDVLNRYMELRGLPEALRARIKDFHAYIHLKSHNMLPDALLRELPCDVQNTVLKERAKIRNQAFLLAVADRLVHRTYNPNAIVVYQHDPLRELFIIREGRIELFTSRNLTIATLLQGDCFGESQMLFDMRHRVSARTATFTEVLVLSYEALSEVVALPQFTKLCPPGGNFGALPKDPGVTAANAASIATVLKYRKLFATLKKAKGKLQGMMSISEQHRNIRVILPTSRFHLYWDALLLFGTMYLAIVVPLRVEYQVEAGMYHTLSLWLPGAQAKTLWNPSLILDYLVDLIFYVEMVLQSSFFAYEVMEGGKARLITSKEEIGRRYITSGQLVLDVGLSFPYDLFGSVFWGYSAIRMPRAFRALCLPSYVSRLKAHFDEIAQWRLQSELYWVVKLLLGTLILALWTSAAWNILHFNGTDQLRSAYWYFVTIVTVGFGDIVPANVRETALADLTMVIGCSSTAIIMGSIISFVAPATATEESAQHRKACLKTFMDRNGISSELEERVTAYYDFIDSEWDGLHSDNVLEQSLPDNLRHDVLRYCTSNLVLSCEFFSSNFEPSIVAMLISRMQLCFYQRTATILSERAKAAGVYFVDKGAVRLKCKAIKSGAGRADGAKAPVSNEVILLTYGGYFGQQGLKDPDFQDELAPHSAEAFTDTQLWLLTQEDYHAVKGDYEVRHPELHSHAHHHVAHAHAAEAVSHAERRRTTLMRRASTLNSEDAEDVLLTSSRAVWSAIITTSLRLAVVMYNILIYPLYFAFLNGHLHPVLPTLMYLGDLYVILHTIWLHRKQRRQPPAIRSEHRSLGWDVAALLPFEIMTPMVHMAGITGNQITDLLRLNRLLWVREVSGMTQQLEKLLSKAGYKLQKDLSNVLKLVIAMVVVAHWYGSLFFLFATYNHFWGYPTWVDAWGLLDYCRAGQLCGEGVSGSTITTQYVASLYWSIETLSTTGYGDIIPANQFEVGFAIMVVLSGVLVLALLISGLSEVVTRMDVTTKLYRQKLAYIVRYGKLRALPTKLRERTRRYMYGLWENQRGITGSELKEYLPTMLYTQLMMELVGTQLKGAFFLTTCRTRVVNQLANALQLELWLPDDCIFAEDQIADKLLLVYRGTVRLVSDATSTVYTTLEGCIVGEGEFFARCPHPCSIRANTVVKAAVLCFDDFWTTLGELGLGETYVAYVQAEEKQLCRLSNRVLVEKVKRNLTHKKAAKMLEEVVIRDRLWYIVNPNSVYRQGWNAVCFAFIACLFIITPIGLALALEPTAQLKTTLYTTNVLGMIDITLRLTVFAIDLDGKLIREPASFRRIYMRTSFLLDVVGILPISPLVPALLARTRWASSHLAGVRVFWLTCIMQYLRMNKVPDYLGGVFGFIEKTTSRNIPVLARSFVGLLVAALIITHTFACLFIVFSPCEIYATNTHLSLDCVRTEQGNLYLTALYWSAYTFSTVGYGAVPIPTTILRILSMFGMLVGCVMSSAGFAAVISASVEGADREAGAKHLLVSALKKFLWSELGTGAEGPEKRMRDYFDYVSGPMRGLSESTALSRFSGPLRRQIVEMFVKRSLSMAVMFSDTGAGTLATIAARMTPYLALPGELLASRAEEDTWVHVLQKGRARLVTAAGETELVDAGTVLSNLEARAAAIIYGCVTSMLRLTVSSFSGGFRQGLKDLRVVVENMGKQYTSGARKGRGGRLRFGDELSIRLAKSRSWVQIKLCARDGNGDVVLGRCKLDVREPRGDAAGHGTGCVDACETGLVLLDEAGQRVGELQVTWSVAEVKKPRDGAGVGRPPADEEHRCDMYAEEYCHLYSIRLDALKEIEACVFSVSMPVMERYNRRLTDIDLHYAHHQCMATPVEGGMQRGGTSSKRGSVSMSAGGRWSVNTDDGPQKLSVTLLAYLEEQLFTHHHEQEESSGQKVVSSIRRSLLQSLVGAAAKDESAFTHLLEHAQQAAARKTTLVAALRAKADAKGGGGSSKAT